MTERYRIPHGLLILYFSVPFTSLSFHVSKYDSNLYFLEKLNTQEKHLYYYYMKLCHQKKTLNISHFLLFMYNNNITGTPLRSVVHVQKGYTVNNLVDI